MEPERVQQTIPFVYLGETSRTAAVSSRALHGTRRERRDFNCSVPSSWALSLGR